MSIKLLYYRLICRICWLLEDIHDLFCEDISSFYPSAKYEDIVGELEEKRLNKEKKDGSL